MKKLVLAFSVLFISLASYSQEITTYYFIRHAEKLRIDKTDRNPNLNDDGLKRAEAWKEVFSTISFDAVYSTDYSRTKLTAKPTADSKNLPLLLYNPSDMYSDAFKNNTKGKTVLVVGLCSTGRLLINLVISAQ